jgi:endoribonuclease Dicer
LIDLVVVHYIFDKFPNATPEHLTRLRSRAVCAPALAALAVRRLRLHTLMLVNNVKLSEAIGKCVPVLEAVSDDQIVNEGWRLDPPKAISDVFESIMGAILVDCGWDYDRAALVIEFIMEDVLGALSRGSSRANPVTELMEWVAKSGCRRLVFEYVVVRQVRPFNVLIEHDGRKVEKQSRLVHGIKILVHGVLVAGPVTSSSAAVAKSLASERALQILKNTASQNALSLLCDCSQPLQSSGALIAISLAVPLDLDLMEEDRVQGGG